jgi:TolB-like protein/Flp pilus assembly protein TadD
MDSGEEQHLCRIEASKEFRESLQLRRLLRFLIRITAQGEVANQYRVAVEALGRPDSFDPTCDPIVRVEMRRLRARLANFYRTHPDESWRIELPERSYSAVAMKTATRVHVPRIAVLPFRLEDGDEACIPLAMGLADDLIYFLRPHSSMAVLARTSVFPLHAAGVTAAEIGARVAAEWVVEGSIHQRGGFYRVAATLQRVTSAEAVRLERHWAEEWNCTAAEIPGVAELIGAAIRSSLSPQRAGAPPLLAPGTPTPDAHLWFLQGWQLLAQRRPETLRQATVLFEKSVAEDAGFLRPRIGLLDAIAIKGLSGFNIASEESRAKRLIQECWQIDSSSADTLAGAGMAEWCFQGNWAGALDLFRQAVEAEPHNVSPYAFYALALVLAGRLEDAYEATRKGLRLDPLSPILYARFGILPLYCGQPLEAVDAFDDAIERYPEFAPNYYHQAMALASVGQTTRALQRIGEAETRSVSNPVIVATKGYVLARHGSAAGAMEIAGQLKSLVDQDLVSPLLPAFVYCGNNDVDRAVDAVRAAVGRKNYCMLPYLASSMMAPLRRWDGLSTLLGSVRITLSSALLERDNPADKQV